MWEEGSVSLGFHNSMPEHGRGRYPGKYHDASMTCMNAFNIQSVYIHNL